MEYRRLGNSGLVVSEIGLGTNNFGAPLDGAEVGRILDQAIDLGVNFIDTADIYAQGESETLIGRILGPRRQQMAVATKFAIRMGNQPHQAGGSRRWVMEAVEASLRRLNTDYIDLYQMHFPDPQTPILETLGALDDLVRQGKIRYVGHSNFSAWQIADAQWTARTEHLALPVGAQNHYHLLRQEVRGDVLSACRTFGIGLIPYFPLASGFLTGKYRPGRTVDAGRLDRSPELAAEFVNEENFKRLGLFECFAKERGHTLIELALGWLLSQPEVATVIAGASSAEQVLQNIESSGWRLDSASIEALAAI
jgi:aryl-alcohol dehydrogenase-like predicted oxidoreductase